MALNSNPHEEACSENKINGLPDEIICHILSFCSPREAIKTSLISHRWNKLWKSVANLNFDENEYYSENMCLQNSTGFTEFVDGFLVNRGRANIRRLQLTCGDYWSDVVSRINAWICTAVDHNVVQIVLRINIVGYYELPERLFMCNTLVSLRLWLHINTRAIVPFSNCFPRLKVLHITVCSSGSAALKKIVLSCCHALEDLIIEGELLARGYSGQEFNIPAPKLRRLRLSFSLRKMESTVRKFCKYGCILFVKVDAPNLEKLDIYYDYLVSYSLKNVKSLSNAKIEFQQLQVSRNHHSDNTFLQCILGHVDRIRQCLAGISSAKNLVILAPSFGDLDIGYQGLLLPMLNSLKHLELRVQTCRCWSSLPNLLNISPNLEHLVIENNINFDEGDQFVAEWRPPEFVPYCLLSHLKTICLERFFGWPSEMKMLRYLLKHGEALNKVTIYSHLFLEDEMKVDWYPIEEIAKVSTFARGSRTCEIDIRNMF